MARCDEGYICDVCGEEVENMVDSDLYLRYILGEVDERMLASAPERHIRCNPTQAQFIVDDDFPPVVVENEFDKRELDPEYVREREEFVTRGWRRLQTVREQGVPIGEYPLPEVRERRSRSPGT